MERFKKIHFIGIGGIGMSALARLLLHEGNAVTGSDRTLSDITHALSAEGATVFDSVAAENVADDVELVVYSGAVKEDDAERREAARKGIPSMNYFEALAMVVNRYHLVAVAGTHGKTTTTAMLADIFEAAEKDPTVIVGSLMARTKSNFRAGKSSLAVVEACEYNRHFLHLEPDVLVITNIEHEHVDCFEDLAAVQEAFRELAMKVPEEGAVVCDTADPNVAPVVSGIAARVIDYREYLDPLMELSVPGVHNRKNAAAAIGVAEFEGVGADVSKKALADFRGAWRRFEYKGDVNGAKVYDDYAHHPTEVRATIAAARELYPDKRVVVVFQPHTYTRTKELFDGFVSALAEADRVLLAPIYAAREENASGVSSGQLAEQIPGAGSFADFESIVSALRESVSGDDVVLVMGAGDVVEVSAGLVG